MYVCYMTSRLESKRSIRIKKFGVYLPTRFAMHCHECRGITQMNYQPRGISDQVIQGPASYLSELGAAEALLKTQPTWNGVTTEAVARMRLQNRFRTGL